MRMYWHSCNYLFLSVALKCHIILSAYILVLYSPLFFSFFSAKKSGLRSHINSAKSEKKDNKEYIAYS